MLEKTLESSWTARSSNLSILKEINSEGSVEELMLNWSSNTLATGFKKPTHWKKPWCWERLRANVKGVAEDEMVGWHYLLNEHEFEQTHGITEGQGNLVASVHGMAKSQTWLCDWTTTFTGFSGSSAKNLPAYIYIYSCICRCNVCSRNFIAKCKIKIN